MSTTQTRTMTTEEVAARFHELAQQEKWFEIQDELFADNVRSVEPSNSPYMGYAEGKAPVRKKGEDFVGRIVDFHGASTTAPVLAGNHFSIGRKMEVTVKPHGRIRLDEVIVYEVKDGQIVLEQFFY